jgi:hypothetical protein
MKCTLASVMAGLTLSALLTAGPVAAQVAPAGKVDDPAARSLVREPGVSGVPQLPDVPPPALRGFGQFEEAPEGTHQPGNAAMRYLRRGAEALGEALRRLQVAAVEDDALAVATARRDCQLLIETMRENNPSDILGDDLDALAGALAPPRTADPGAPLARLRAAAMDFRFLYPSCDLEQEVATIDRALRDGHPDAALAETRTLRQTIAVAPATAPAATLERAFADAQRALDARQVDEARGRIRAAREAAGAVRTAGFLGEAVWYLDRTADALAQGLPEIARVSVTNAGAFLDAAAEEAPALRDQLAAPRADATRLARQIEEGVPVPPDRVRTDAGRVQALSPAR